VAQTGQQSRRHTRQACLERLAQVWAPLSVDVDRAEGSVTLRDRDVVVRYELWLRGGLGRFGAPGWVERDLAADGTVTSFAVPTAEVMAVLRDTGQERAAAAMTCALARWFEQAEDSACVRVADRLRAEVAAGERRERVSLRALQGRIVERLVAGETLSEMCERAGFRAGDGNVDTSWLQRRAGLLPARCWRTGKQRLARTASYEVFCQLVRSVEADPHEFGV
jgi:hypothetical protein